VDFGRQAECRPASPCECRNRDGKLVIDADIEHRYKALTYMSIHTTILEVRVMSPVDLAVSKLARFGDADREGIEILASSGGVQRRGGRR
jgi:hypothetical protein